MKLLAIMAIWMGAMLCIAFGQVQFVTSPGKYTVGEGKASLDIKLPDANHLALKIEFKSQRVEESTGRIINSKRSSETKEPMPVTPEAWAFCLVAEDEIWGYFGRGNLIYYKNTSKGLITRASCSEENLGELAPQVLQAWIKSKETNQPASPEPSARP